MLLNDDKASFSNFVGPESSALLFLPLYLTFPTGGCVIATSYFPHFFKKNFKTLRSVGLQPPIGGCVIATSYFPDFFNLKKEN